MGNNTGSNFYDKDKESAKLQGSQKKTGVVNSISSIGKSQEQKAGSYAMQTNKLGMRNASSFSKKSPMKGMRRVHQVLQQNDIIVKDSQSGEGGAMGGKRTGENGGRGSYSKSSGPKVLRSRQFYEPPK